MFVRPEPGGRATRPVPPRRQRPAGRRLPAAWPLVALLTLFLSAAACGGGDERAPHLTSRGTTIVCLGDSITAGSGAPAEAAYPRRLSESLGLPVVNAGVPGDTTGGALARLADVLARDPWLVIVELGGNDLLRRQSASVAEENLAAILQGLSNANVAAVLVEVEPPLLGGDFKGLHRRLADRFDVPLVRGVVSEVLSDPSRKSDQIHPNAAGYADIARAVARVVEPLVEERREAGLTVAPDAPLRDAA